MAIGNQSQAKRYPFSLGVMPSTPGLGISRSRPVNGRRGGGGLGLRMPSAESVDYAHKLTTTSVLLIGAVAFLVVARGKPKRALLRGLARKHIAEIR